MATAMEIIEGLNFPRVSQAKAVTVTIRDEEYPACQYLDLFDNTWTLYVPTKELDGMDIKHSFNILRGKFRFIDQNKTIWFVIAFKIDRIVSQHSPFHPFGQNVILKQISPEMAKAIQLSVIEIKITIK